MFPEIQKPAGSSCHDGLLSVFYFLGNPTIPIRRVDCNKKIPA